MITGAALKAMQDDTYSCRWKTDAGFVELTAPQILAIADAVGGACAGMLRPGSGTAGAGGGGDYAGGSWRRLRGVWKHPPDSADSTKIGHWRRLFGASPSFYLRGVGEISSRWTWPDVPKWQLRIICLAGFGLENTDSLHAEPYQVAAVIHFIAYPFYAGERSDWKGVV